MKDIHIINSGLGGKVKHINNVYPFTYFPNQNQNEINCKSENYSKNTKNINSKKKFKKYTINLDWLQFVAKKHTNLNFSTYHSKKIIISEVNSYNHNFLKCYSIVLLNTEICELHTIPTNKNFKSDEVSIKVNNKLLYSEDCIKSINYVLAELNLHLVRISRIDIALDGADNLKVFDWIVRFSKTKTIQINNNNLDITPHKFNKEELKYETYKIGNKNYQKIATVYNKTKEIRSSKKDYITKFWQLNGLSTTEEIGRFELSLGYRHLKKYVITSMEQISDIKFIGAIFKEEISGWFKLYKVKLQDIKNHRKNIAIEKGKQISLFKWNQIPHKSTGLETKEIQPNKEREAKKSVTFSLSYLIDNFPNNFSTSGCTVGCICSVTEDFDINNHMTRKLKEKLGKATHLDNNQKSFISRELNIVPRLQRE